MEYTPTRDGTVPFKIPALDEPCFTYYKVYGDLGGRGIPLVCLHGGPAAGHESMIPFAELWKRHGIPVVVYDQIGCGLSTHLPEKDGDESFWQVSLFVSELENLLDHLQLRTGYHLLGHSFGGMITPEFAGSQPKGLQRLILANGVASKDLCNRSFDILRASLPSEHQQALNEAEKTKNFESPGMQNAWVYILKHHMCRSDAQPPPAWFTNGVKVMMEAKGVMDALVGPSPMFDYGSLKGWTSIPNLHRITAPTLIFNSEFDTSSLDVAQQPFFNFIPRVRWHKFMGAGHLPWLDSEEMLEKVLNVVGTFLAPKSYENM